MADDVLRSHRSEQLDLHEAHVESYLVGLIANVGTSMATASPALGQRLVFARVTRSA